MILSSIVVLLTSGKRNDSVLRPSTEILLTVSNDANLALVLKILQKIRMPRPRLWKSLEQSELFVTSNLLALTNIIGNVAAELLVSGVFTDVAVKEILKLISTITTQLRKGSDITLELKELSAMTIELRKRSQI